MASKIAVITGPTATGKTKLGVEMARSLGGEVVGADSMQIYKFMDIGTAKPAEEEKKGIPHYMIDVVMPTENFSVSRYVEMASRCVDDIIKRGKLPIIVGGTGLYIDALVSGLDFAPETEDHRLRDSLSSEYDRVGGEKMLERLQAVDAASGEKLHPNDKKRIVRALEVYELSGKTISEHNRDTLSRPPRYEAGKIVLNFKNRQDLYDRIDRRADAMISSGLEDEVRALIDMGAGEDSTAMQAIGYKEMAKALRGRISKEQAAEEIRRESRRYAKRQLSWLRRDKNAFWINWSAAPDFGEGLRDSTKFLEETGII